MIHHLRGRLTEKFPTYAVIECGGVGYLINISLNTFSKLGDKEECKLLIHMIVREDAQLLYGFHSEEERAMFKHLVSVSGVGPSTAQTVLSGLTPEEVQQAIIDNDVSQLKRVKGIGGKSALRIIVDLKDKLEKEGVILIDTFAGSNNTKRNEALSALVTLGFDRKTAGKALDLSLQTLGEDAAVEELIRVALKKL